SPHRRHRCSNSAVCRARSELELRHTGSKESRYVETKNGTLRDWWCAVLISLVRTLPPDHQYGERPRDCGSLTATAAAGRCCRRRPALDAHDEDVAGRRVKRQRPSAIHGLKVLLDLERRGTFLLHHCQRSIAMRAERFHGLRIEHGAIRAARKR